VIEGWIPVTRYKELEDKLNSSLKGQVVIEETETKELPPTLMKNNPRINYFEFFVRFFSLPQSEEIDPTITLAIVFPIFFGMMLGDVGYGLVILLVGFWFAAISSGKANTKWLPLPLRKFGKSLIPKRALGSLGRILIPSAIVGMIFGVLVNAYFGFKLPIYKPVFDLITAPQIYLVITLFVGLAHISLGYLYGIYIALHWGHKKHAYAKIGWLGFLWSGVVTLYAVFSGVLGAPVSSLVLYAGLGGLVVFGAVVFALEKMRFVMEIPTIISHVVSYGRILGVLLASFLLGYIASVSLEGAVGGPIGGFAVTVVVLLLVTILNIVLGIFEPAIQGIRLHYVEFYSKFFEGNGKRFQPFAEKRELTKKVSST
jgi:V/A-type H+/Na+-transporting ATPase subunit I